MSLTGRGFNRTAFTTVKIVVFAPKRVIELDSHVPSHTSSRLLKKISSEDPIPLRPGATVIPGRVGAVIRRSLARSPAARYPDVRAMRAALLGG